MSLENVQALQNGFIAATSNVSASNDPKQIPNDATETLIKGAELASAGRTLGMSEEETLAQVSKQYRRQAQRDAYNSRNKRDADWAQKKASLGDWDAQAEIDGVGYSDTADEDWAFGEDPEFNAANRKSGKTRASESQTYSEGDPQFAEQELDRRRGELSDLDEEIARSKRQGIKRNNRSDRRKRTELRTEINRLNDPMERPSNAPTSAMADALAALEDAADAPNYGDVGPDGATAAEIQARLERHLASPRARRDADRAAGREAVRRSQQGQSVSDARNRARIETNARLKPERRVYDRDTEKFVYRVEPYAPGPDGMPYESRERRDAEYAIARELTGQTFDPRVQAVNDANAARRELITQIINEEGRANLGNIGEIAGIGSVKSGEFDERPQGSSVVPQIAVDAQGNFVDARGAAVEDPFFDDDAPLPNDKATANPVNRPTSANGLNAPTDVRSWIELNRPNYRESSSSFGNYPQVDITQETTNFANKIRNLGQQLGMDGLTNVSANVRTVDELQSAVDMVIGGMAEKGKRFYMKNPETGKNEAVSNPGVAEVMQKLRMTSGDTERLANAMYQMDSARRSQVNQNANQAYDARMTPGASLRSPGPVERNRSTISYDSPEAVGGDLTPIAQAPFGSKVEGKDIRASLRGLPTPDAARPYIGQVQGEEPRISRFKPGGMGSGEELERNLRRQAISRQKPGQKLDTERMRSNIRNAREVEDRSLQANRERNNQTPTFTGAIRGQQENQFVADNSARIQGSAEDALRKRLSGGNPPGEPPRKPPAAASPAPQEPSGGKSSSADSSIIRTIKERAQSAREGAQSRVSGLDPRTRRGLTAAAIAGGAALAGKGLYDVTRPEEQESNLMVRYA